MSPRYEESLRICTTRRNIFLFCGWNSAIEWSRVMTDWTERGLRSSRPYQASKGKRWRWPVSHWRQLGDWRALKMSGWKLLDFMYWEEALSIVRRRKENIHAPLWKSFFELVQLKLNKHPWSESGAEGCANILSLVRMWRWETSRLEIWMSLLSTHIQSYPIEMNMLSLISA